MEGRGRRVAITGYGVVAPCGIGKQAFWDGLLGPALTDGRTTSDRRLGSARPGSTTPRRPAGPTAVEQFAVGRGRRGVRAGRPTRRRPRLASARSSAPASAACTPSRSRSQIRLEKGDRRVSPFLVPMMMANAAGRVDLDALRPAGPERDHRAPPARPSTHAIGYAARLIAWGMCDAMVTGGTEAPHHPHRRRRVRQHDRAVDQRRQLPVRREAATVSCIGEGAGVLVLEEWEPPSPAAPTILGEVLGAGQQRRRPPHHRPVPRRRRRRRAA